MLDSLIIAGTHVLAVLVGFAITFVSSKDRPIFRKRPAPHYPSPPQVTQEWMDRKIMAAMMNPNFNAEVLARQEAKKKGVGIPPLPTDVALKESMMSGGGGGFQLSRGKGKNPSPKAGS